MERQPNERRRPPNSRAPSRRPSQRSSANRKPTDGRRRSGAERSGARLQRTGYSMMKTGCILGILAPVIFIIIIIFVMCGGNGATQTVLGEAIEYPTHIGTRGVIYANREDVTDELLIEFLNDYDISEYNWFTIDFGNGTGYYFVSNWLFSYGPITDAGGVSERPFYYAEIRNNRIEWFAVLGVPQFRTVGEYYNWANQHNIEMSLISSSRPTENLLIENYLDFEVTDHPLSAVEGDTMFVRIE